MKKRNDRESWSDERIYFCFIALAGAVEIGLVIVQGVTSMGPLGGTHLAQIGAVFGSGVVGAVVTTIGRGLLL